MTDNAASVHHAQSGSRDGSPAFTLMPHHASTTASARSGNASRPAQRRGLLNGSSTSRTGRGHHPSVSAARPSIGSGRSGGSELSGTGSWAELSFGSAREDLGFTVRRPKCADNG